MYTITVSAAELDQIASLLGRDLAPRKVRSAPAPKAAALPFYLSPETDPGVALFMQRKHDPNWVEQPPKLPKPTKIPKLPRGEQGYLESQWRRAATEMRERPNLASMRRSELEQYGRQRASVGAGK